MDIFHDHKWLIPTTCENTQPFIPSGHYTMTKICIHHSTKIYPRLNSHSTNFERADCRNKPPTSGMKKQIMQNLTYQFSWENEKWRESKKVGRNRSRFSRMTKFVLGGVKRCGIVFYLFLFPFFPHFLQPPKPSTSPVKTNMCEILIKKEIDALSVSISPTPPIGDTFLYRSS